MRLTNDSIEPNDIAESRFTLEDITDEDIGPPSEHFMRIVRDLEGFKFLNSFTIDEFTKQVRQRFASRRQ